MHALALVGTSVPSTGSATYGVIRPGGRPASSNTQRLNYFIYRDSIHLRHSAKPLGKDPP